MFIFVADCNSERAPSHPRAHPPRTKTGGMRGLLLLLLGALARTSAASPITLARYLGDHMVLLADAVSPPAVVWGFGSPGVNATLTRLPDGVVVGPVPVTPDGVWRFPLPPTPASLTPYSITINATDGSSVSMSDVLFGYVFGVGGQSNAQFTVTSAANASAEIAAASLFPQIRLMTVGQGTFSNTTLDDLATVEQPWCAASNASVGVGNWTAFSAVGWFFARDLANALGPDVPIGVLSVNYGGTPIAAWNSLEALGKCGPLPPPPLWGVDGEEVGASDPPTPSPYTNATLFNAMINPLTVGPMGMTGFLYYQGEADAPPFPTNATWYACQQRAMVADWRARLSNPSLWFAPVQLAPFIGPEGTGWADIRAAQLAVLELPHTAFATAADSGDPDAPFGSYHPRNKQVVGSRLAAAALDMVVGIPTPWGGPAFSAAAAETTPAGDITVTLALQPGTVHGGSLTVRDGVSCPTALGVPAALCQSFVVVASPGPNPPPPVYSFLGVGYLAAGDDLTSGTMTVGEAETLCTNLTACLGFTYATNETSPPAGPVDVYLKSAVNYSPAAGWQAFSSSRDPRGVLLPATAAVGPDGQTVVLTAKTTGEGQAAVAVSYGYSTWPLLSVYDGAGLPLGPFYAELPAGRGAEIKE
jgi:sialate O-acetylesterase